MQAEGVRRSCLEPLKPSGLPCWCVCPRPGKRHRWDKWGPVLFFLSQKECTGPREVGGCPDYHRFASCPVCEGSEGLDSLLGVPVCCPRPSLHTALYPRMQMNSDPSWFQLSDTVILVWLSASHVSVVYLKSKCDWGIWIFIWQSYTHWAYVEDWPTTPCFMPDLGTPDFLLSRCNRDPSRNKQLNHYTPSLPHRGPVLYRAAAPASTQAAQESFSSQEWFFSI